MQLLTCSCLKRKTSLTRRSTNSPAPSSALTERLVAPCGRVTEEGRMMSCRATNGEARRPCPVVVEHPKSQDYPGLMTSTCLVKSQQGFMCVSGTHWHQIQKAVKNDEIFRRLENVWRNEDLSSLAMATKLESTVNPALCVEAGPKHSLPLETPVFSNSLPKQCMGLVYLIIHYQMYDPNVATIPYLYIYIWMLWDLT